MYKYCENVDGNHEFVPIASSVVDLGVAGELFLDVSIGDSEDGPILALDGVMKNANRGCVREATQIRYCPICGEVLQKTQKKTGR